MSINYNLSVSTSKPWTLFKLLFKWKGSIWKSIIVELLVWLILFYILNSLYRFALSDVGKIRFEKAIAYCDDALTYIPLSFMLGFFVTAVLNRWLSMYGMIGFIDNLALKTSIYIRGESEEAVMYRRTIIRYSILSQVMYFRDISMRVRRRFPTIDSVVEAGYLLAKEKDVWESQKFKYGKNWMFMQWALTLIYEARQRGFIESDYYQCQLSEDVAAFRSNLAKLVMYDMVPIPQVYPQLICMAVHTFFLLSVVAEQFVVPERASPKQVDIYFPLNGVLQFIFYMGWMKIAEVMLNPFGEDDDDFETNRLIDRNLAVGLDAAVHSYATCPPLTKDDLMERKNPLYSEDAAKLPNNQLRESVSHIILKPTRMKYMTDMEENGMEQPLLRQSLRKLSSYLGGKNNKKVAAAGAAKAAASSTGDLSIPGKIIEPPKRTSNSISDITELERSDSRSSGGSFQEDFHAYSRYRQNVRELKKCSTNLNDHPCVSITIKEEDEDNTSNFSQK